MLLIKSFNKNDLCLTAFSSVWWFSFLWFLCGMAQGPAWAACGVLLKKVIRGFPNIIFMNILAVSRGIPLN